ncbi:sensor histidine kinase [Aquimarina sp. Aq78]|uniref:sensor histidine kinase n=1 Tax=Aquimarina sp. Aq78 TaxID=1191889 RepID=UPI000D10AFDA|nr:histidine kinase [Aquimarina sp. Aq78]
MTFRFLNHKNLPISIKKIVLAALAVSLFFILKAYTNHLINQFNYPFSWILISLKISIAYLLWVVLIPLVYSLVKMLQDNSTTVLYKILMFTTGCVVLAVFHQILSSRINDFINYLNNGYMKSFFGRNSITVLVVGSFSSFIELLVIIASFLALDYQKKYIRNQKELIAAQLNALRMQLQPHFLFNTLHSIAAMIDIDTKNAQKMLSKLGGLLRNVLEYDAEQMVTVADELNFIKNYLDLEQVRYQDRVTIDYDIPDDVLDIKIPNMIFQPLVENAVKYGIIPTIDDGKIDITIKQERCKTLQENALVLQITNTYNSKSTMEKPIGTGVGLVNIRKRLQQFYQNRFVFTSHFQTKELYVARITVPIIT